VKIESQTQPSGEVPKKRFGAPPGNQRAKKHGLTAVLHPRKHPFRRYREGRETRRFRLELISDAGGIESMTAAKKAMADILVAKFNRLLRCYRWQYEHAQVPLVNTRKKSLYPIIRELDALEDSFFKCAKEFGFERVAKVIGIDAIKARYERGDEAEGNGEDQPANEEARHRIF
jgi:hypothetical protein